MNKKIKQVVSESRIIQFCTNFNKNLLFLFYNSKTYNIFIKLNNFFRDIILKSKDKSSIIKITKKILKYVELKDIGWFIILVVLFNTLAMIVLKKEIDIFSKTARISFFLLGLFLILKKTDNR